jgi:FPC/CPF motif-containing protein YcgG
VGTRAGPGVLAQMVTDSFAGLAGSASYPCLGARSVVHRDAYTLRMYSRLGDQHSATQLAADLAVFGADVDGESMSSFVAAFEEPTSLSESEFHALLWRHLQLLHGADRGRFAWDDRVNADPEHPHFSFSVGGVAYFVIGLNAGSSRWARRFAWPALVFNPHEQFVAMRESGKYDRVRSMIRSRDTELQGSANPLLRDHGDKSEARQYAGDAVPDGWRCPLDVELSR